MASDAYTLREIPSQLCEERSYEMAKYSYNFGKANGAKVIFMTFGAKHTHGVIQQLRKFSASFIVFSPNR